MNKDTLQGQWKQLVGHVKEQWGKLSDNDVARVEGNYDQLVGLLQEKYGYARDRAEREINDWAAAHDKA